MSRPDDDILLGLAEELQRDPPPRRRRPDIARALWAIILLSLVKCTLP